MHEADDDRFLRTLGERVRELRARRGMTRRILAKDSGVSERYLAQLETGQGNASVLLVRAVARALGVSIETLVAESDGEAPGISAPDKRAERIALIGLRGAGKSTLGRALAERRGVPFIELDREVERAAGVPLATIFDIYGQPGFRRLERDALERLLAEQGAFVLATGGSLVSEPATYERLRATCFTVWLSAAPVEHMERVVAQGDMRPMADNDESMADLKRILAAREPLYRRADVEVSTAGRTPAESLSALLEAVPPESP